MDCDCWCDTIDDEYEYDDIGAIEWRWMKEYDCWCDTDDRKVMK